jgi:uncharacterized protein (DUF433 family)
VNTIIIIIAWNPGPQMALELRILCYVHLEWRRLTWEAHSTVEAGTKVRSSRQNQKKASGMVQTDPAIMGGTPVFRGTRIPVYSVADMIEQGTPIKEILEGYPSLTRKMVEYAHIYAATHTRPGRPPIQPWSGTKPVGRK